MNDQWTKHDGVLMSLVSWLESMAMVQLGKVASPHTGEVERDLDGASGTIDILDMLKAKCRHDTPAELVRTLDRMVMDLQMNYLEEKRKSEPGDDDDAAADEPAADAAEAADAPAEDRDAETGEPAP